MRWIRRKPRWQVVVRPRGRATRSIRIRLGKLDSIETEYPPGRTTVQLAKPPRRIRDVHPYDRLEVWRNGQLLSSLPIRSMIHSVASGQVIIHSQEVPF